MPGVSFRFRSRRRASHPKNIGVLLAPWGYIVSSFTDPEKASKHLKSHPSKYSRIVTDVWMPCISCVEFAQCTKKMRQDIKVLVMIVFKVDREMRASLPSSIERKFLQKPFRTAGVCAAVKTCLLK